MTINNVGNSSIINQASINIQRSSERIASGLQINSAADDAAGLAVANRFNVQATEFSQSARNANDGISLLQVAEGGLSSVTDSLERIRELSLQASNGVLNDSDREALNNEAQQLRDEIVRTVESTNFNGQNVLSASESVNIQIGSSEEDQIEVGGEDLSALLDNIDFENLDLSTQEGAQNALDLIDQVQEGVDSSSAEVGAQINRLDSSINTLLNSEVTTVESSSRIESADIAREISELAANNIRQETAIALQGQANQEGRNVLRLLGL